MTSRSFFLMIHLLSRCGASLQCRGRLGSNDCFESHEMSVVSSVGTVVVALLVELCVETAVRKLSVFKAIKMDIL